MPAWKVRYIDYPASYQKIREEILGIIDDTLTKGDVMLRQQLTDFEDHLAEFVGTKYAVGISNCTDAMHLTLRAAGIGSGDEVITVSHTMVATAAAIHHAGAKPVLVDIGDDHLIDVGRVEAAITPRTKAIMPVQLNGRICDMDRLMAVAELHGLLVVEDSAQALGATFNGSGAGSIGLAGCFSFYPAKILGTFGDGGAVVTDSEEIAEKVKLLRNHGRMDNGDVSGWSFNCRLDNIHAAVLDFKLKLLPEWISRRRELAHLYHDGLQNVTELHLPPAPVDEGPHHDVYQNYEIEAKDRDGLVNHLTEQGVETMITWGGRGVHQFPSLGLTHHELPRTDEMFKKVLMLPMNPELHDADVLYVTQAIRGYYSE